MKAICAAEKIAATPVLDSGNVHAAHDREPSGSFMHVSRDAFSGLADAHGDLEWLVVLPFEQRIYLHLEIQNGHSVRVSTDDRNELSSDVVHFGIDSEIRGDLCGDIVVDVQFFGRRLCVDASQQLPPGCEHSTIERSLWARSRE
jgi:hypothetical protein